MIFSADTVVQRSALPVETMVGSEIVLMSIESGKCFGLGDTGSDVWRLLAEPITVADIAAKLSESYDAPTGEIKRDVETLLEHMQALSLITTGVQLT